jgi:hypothetical protein
MTRPGVRVQISTRNVSWYRAGDVPRVFNTLATIITLLDADRQPGDVVFLDEVMRSHNACHHDRRVRRRQAAAVASATERLAPSQAEAERSKAQRVSLREVLLRARRALAPASQEGSEASEVV